MMHQLHLLIRQKEKILKKRKILNASIENNGVYALNIAMVLLLLLLLLFLSLLSISTAQKNEVFH